MLDLQEIVCVVRKLPIIDDPTCIRCMFSTSSLDVVVRDVGFMIFSWPLTSIKATKSPIPSWANLLHAIRALGSFLANIMPNQPSKCIGQRFEPEPITPLTILYV